jgi:hypothetical protein
MGTIAAAMDTGDIVPLGMTPQRSVDEAQQELGL